MIFPNVLPKCRSGYLRSGVIEGVVGRVVHAEPATEVGVQARQAYLTLAQWVAGLGQGPGATAAVAWVRDGAAFDQVLAIPPEQRKI
jgi:hypothetical protein